ncbi:MAG: hypothetical protein RL141_643 [Candidatus Parcubacteria bacterium]|jgi:hypothetical protein
MLNDHRLLMLSAMYENGGNTTHRLLDGHPELFVYPFESQPGTRFVNDAISSLYPLKYRWPIFPSSASVDECYHQIIDEECKVRTKTPFVSKFRDADFQLTDPDRLQAFRAALEGVPLTRPNVMHAFFQSTFEAWKNVQRTGKERMHVGYSPIIGVDGDKIIRDYDGKAYVLHVVRNPFSAYADTKKRAVPLSVDHYMLGWNTCQYYATLFQQKYPDNFFVVKFEDIVANPVDVLGGVLARMGCGSSPTLAAPSWNGKVLDQVYPWGTVRIPTPEANLATAAELPAADVDEIYARTHRWIVEFGYEGIARDLRARVS